MSPKDPNELGALWEKTSSRGPYMTGTIEGIGAVVLFKNDRKTSDKQPDWRILRSRPKEERQASAPVDDEERW